MDKRRVLQTIWIAWILLSPLPAQAILLGERLEYKITWLGIPVGVGELWAKEKVMLEGREVIHVVGFIRTNKVLSTIFPIRDEAHSWIDAETYESVQFEKKVNELIIKAHERMIFDGEKQKGYFESLDSGQTNEFKVKRPVHDVFSVFYWVRRQALDAQESAQTIVIADQKEWAFEAHAKRYEMVKWNGRKVKTLRIEPSTSVNGIAKRKRAWFNLTANETRIPIRIVYKAPMGRLIGTLAKAGPGELKPQ